jgi:hypothetical protein
MTHDYVPNGTTNLFAALEVAGGSVIAHHYRRHRHQEFLRFLKLIDEAVPSGRCQYALDMGPCATDGSECARKVPDQPRSPATVQVSVVGSGRAGL